tara:strand:+ start:3565 stop:4317 length:753 start_codon:yes stop_codon:yes gene_type:complete
MEKKIRFSIITVVKNDHQKIEKTIKSVIRQSFQNFEYIIIDGKSNDGTIEIVKKYEKYINFFSSQKDKNLWDALNKGIENSKGEIIFILNSGDLIFKNALEIANRYFTKFNIDFLFGAIKKNRIFYKFEPEKINYRFNIYPSHSGSFFIRSIKQRELGLYDTKLDYCSDYDLFFRMIKKKKFYGLSTKKSELIGKFDMTGISSKIPFYKYYFYEMKVRKKNGQNLFYLIILYFLKIINKFRNYIINLIKN